MIPMESKSNALIDDDKKSKIKKNHNREIFFLNNSQIQHEFDRK
jgi:hypothetical protein